MFEFVDFFKIAFISVIKILSSVTFIIFFAYIGYKLDKKFKVLMGNLHYAIDQEPKLAWLMLKNRRINVNRLGIDGRTPLMQAIIMNETKIAMELL